MNEYMPLIMGAAFVIALSIATKLVMGRGSRNNDKQQSNFDFPNAPKVEHEHQHEIAAGGRR